VYFYAHETGQPGRPITGPRHKAVITLSVNDFSAEEKPLDASGKVALGVPNRYNGQKATVVVVAEGFLGFRTDEFLISPGRQAAVSLKSRKVAAHEEYISALGRVKKEHVSTPECEQAERGFRKATNLDQDHPEARLELARILLTRCGTSNETERYQEAAEIYGYIVRRGWDSARFYGQRWQIWSEWYDSLLAAGSYTDESSYKEMLRALNVDDPLHSAWCHFISQAEVSEMKAFAEAKFVYAIISDFDC
jgi:hypothetical protein